MPKIVIIGTLDVLFEQDSRVYGVDGLAPTLRAKSVSLNTPSGGGVMVMEVEHLDKRFLGSVYGYGSGFAGAVWDSNSVAPTLNTMQGGDGNRPLWKSER